jgi:NADPH2:quinone reductase
VWLWNGQWKRAFGTAAEWIVLPQAQAVPLPAGVSFEQGACLGIPAMTARHAVFLTDAHPGSVLLISGGAGAVAHYAIQFAKARGATVLTTVSSAAKAQIALAAGADHAIDYKREDVGQRVHALTGNRGVDAVIELDLAANARLIPAVLRPKGSVIVYGTGAADAVLPATFCLQNAITLKFFLVYELTAGEHQAAINEITRMLEQGKLIHNMALTLPLHEVAAGHQSVEHGEAIGNVVLRL